MMLGRRISRWCTTVDITHAVVQRWCARSSNGCICSTSTCNTVAAGMATDAVRACGGSGGRLQNLVTMTSTMLLTEGENCIFCREEAVERSKRKAQTKEKGTEGK